MFILALFTTSTTPKGSGCGITGECRIINLADPHQIVSWRPYKKHLDSDFCNMNKIIILLISLFAINAYSLSIFGITIGDTTIRNIDTLIYIEPLESKVNAKLYCESGTVQVVECFIKKDTASGAFAHLKKYFTAVFGEPRAITDVLADEYCIWKAENCCIELSGQKTDSVVTIRIDAAGKVRFQMLQQMESLYDSIAVIRSKKDKQTDFKK